MVVQPAKQLKNNALDNMMYICVNKRD